MTDTRDTDRLFYFAAKALVLRNGRFLALRRTNEKRDLWELPGGRMEFGERLDETLVREVREETSLEVEPIRILDSWDWITEKLQISGVIYLCSAKAFDVILSDEHFEYRWFSKSDIERLYPVYVKKLGTIEWNVLEEEGSASSSPGPTTA